VDAESERTGEVTALLRRLRHGDGTAADALLPLVYGELRAIAGSYFRGSAANHTLQPTALVHELFLRLLDRTSPEFASRAHFVAVSSKAMRNILADHARKRRAAKRGGDHYRVTLTDALSAGAEVVDLLLLDEVLTRLSQQGERYAPVVEMRIFGGLTVAEIAEVLGVSRRTVDNDWRFAKAWLRVELGDPGSAGA